MKDLFKGGVMYRPLPECLTIKNSKIEGLGLFAVIDIPKGIDLGISHIKLLSKWERTPLGGFYNHSEEPNCIKVSHRNQFKEWLELRTIKEIKAGEEITVEYTLYKIK